MDIFAFNAMLYNNMLYWWQKLDDSYRRIVLLVYACAFGIY